MTITQCELLVSIQALHLCHISEVIHERLHACRLSYLLLGLEDVAAEDVTLSVSCDVAENLQILRVMRHVEYPER